MKNIAIIPARSGSKGLPHKNIKNLCDKPLIAYTIETAINSNMYDTVFVSTDSEEYSEIAIRHGAEVPFFRSEYLATDEAGTWDVVSETLIKYKELGKNFDTFTVLQPTSPLRKAEHIKEAFDLYNKKDAKAVVSLCEVDHSPLWSNTLPENLAMDKFVRSDGEKRRQEIEKYYRFNGAIYISDVKHFEETGDIYSKGCFAYIMDRENSIDIDTELDFLIAKTILEENNRIK